MLKHVFVILMYIHYALKYYGRLAPRRITCHLLPWHYAYIGIKSFKNSKVNSFVSGFIQTVAFDLRLWNRERCDIKQPIVRRRMRNAV